VKRYWTRAALIYVDLDGFKPVNDQHGHPAGDAVLTAIAAMLARSVRASDTVARLGGDEFGLILWNLSEADAAAKPGRSKLLSAKQASNGTRHALGRRLDRLCHARPSTTSATCSPRPTTRCMPARRPGKAANYHPRVNKCGRSRNDIRRELILDKGNPVLQVQLALLQPLNLQNIGAGRRFERSNCGVEVAMFCKNAQAGREARVLHLWSWAAKFHRTAAVKRRRNPNKYRALRVRHQGGMRCPGMMRITGFDAAAQQQSRRLAGHFCQNVQVRNLTKEASSMSVNRILRNWKKASGARERTRRRHDASFGRRRNDRRTERRKLHVKDEIARLKHDETVSVH